jgi:hypothetical protein
MGRQVDVALAAACAGGRFRAGIFGRPRLLVTLIKETADCTDFKAPAEAIGDSRSIQKINHRKQSICVGILYWYSK